MALLNRYFSELGRNAYALFNEATDFASHPPEIRSIPRDPHGMQKRVGTWPRNFVALLAKDPKPDLSKYLAKRSLTHFSRN